MTPNANRHQPFSDRGDTGIVLTAQLGHIESRRDLVVLALPRGGVPERGELLGEHAALATTP